MLYSQIFHHFGHCNCDVNVVKLQNEKWKFSMHHVYTLFSSSYASNRISLSAASVFASARADFCCYLYFRHMFPMADQRLWSFLLCRQHQDHTYFWNINEHLHNVLSWSQVALAGTSWEAPKLHLAWTMCARATQQLRSISHVCTCKERHHPPPQPTTQKCSFAMGSLTAG